MTGCSSLRQACRNLLGTERKGSDPKLMYTDFLMQLYPGQSPQNARGRCSQGWQPKRCLDQVRHTPLHARVSAHCIFVANLQRVTCTHAISSGKIFGLVDLHALLCHSCKLCDLYAVRPQASGTGDIRRKWAQGIMHTPDSRP
jgi:hypothetical protein